MLKERLDLVVVDAAGTTLDVGGAVPAALERAFGEHGLSVSREEIAAVHGRSKREAVAALVRHAAPAAADPEDLSARIFERFRRELEDELSAVRPLPGAGEALLWLRSKNLPVVLTTGFDRALIAWLLARVGCDPGPLSGSVCADDVARGRPHPDLVLRAMELVGCADPARVAVVGDTTADLQAGHAAGAGCLVGVLSGAHDHARLDLEPHTVLLPDIAALPAWLQQGDHEPHHRRSPPDGAERLTGRVEAAPLGTPVTIQAPRALVSKATSPSAHCSRGLP